MLRISYLTFFRSLHHWSGHATLLSRNYHATEAHTYNHGHRHTHWHTRSLRIVEAAALGHVLPAPRQASSPYFHPRRGNRDPTGPISYRTSAKISPTRGSNPAKGLIASLCTSVNERASARCAATDKRDHHLECQANSEARFKCGSSELAL